MYVWDKVCTISNTYDCHMLCFPTRPTTTCHKPQCQQLQTQTRRDRQWDSSFKMSDMLFYSILLFPLASFSPSVLLFPHFLITMLSRGYRWRSHIRKWGQENVPIHLIESLTSAVIYCIAPQWISTALELKLLAFMASVWGLFLTGNRTISEGEICFVAVHLTDFACF